MRKTKRKFTNKSFFRRLGQGLPRLEIPGYDKRTKGNPKKGQKKKIIR